MKSHPKQRKQLTMNKNNTQSKENEQKDDKTKKLIALTTQIVNQLSEKGQQECQEALVKLVKNDINNRVQYAPNPAEEDRETLLNAIKLGFEAYLKLDPTTHKLTIFDYPGQRTYHVTDEKSMTPFLACKGFTKTPSLEQDEETGNDTKFTLFSLDEALYALDKPFFIPIQTFNKNHVWFGESSYGKLRDGRLSKEDGKLSTREKIPKKQEKKIEVITTCRRSNGKDAVTTFKQSKIEVARLASKRKIKTVENLFSPIITPFVPNYEHLIRELDPSHDNPWFREDQTVSVNRYLTNRFGFDSYWVVKDNNGNIINLEKRDDWIELYINAWKALLTNLLQFNLFFMWKSKVVCQPDQMTKGKRCPLFWGFYDHDGRTGKSFLLYLITELVHPFGKLVTDPKTVFGRNNASIENKVLLFLDDAQLKNSLNQQDRIKTLATSPTLDVQDKYIPSYSINNNSHTVCAFNRVDTNVGQMEGRIRLCDAYNIDVDKFILPLTKASNEVNFHYFITQYLLKEWFIPYEIQNFTTHTWEQQPFDGEIWRAKKKDTDYGGILHRELFSHASAKALAVAYKRLLPELSDLLCKENSIRLMSTHLRMIYKQGLKKQGLEGNGQANGVQIEQVIKELRKHLGEDFVAKSYTRKGVSRSCYLIDYSDH
jgi:hypothetical protein